MEIKGKVHLNIRAKSLANGSMMMSRFSPKMAVGPLIPKLIKYSFRVTCYNFRVIFEVGETKCAFQDKHLLPKSVYKSLHCNIRLIECEHR